MKTQVMKRSDTEKKAVAENYGQPVSFGAGDYPHGLCISLGDSELRKLGIDRMPKPGDKFKIEGEAHVLGSEQRDTDKNSDRRVDLVLHELGAEPIATPGKRQTTVREDLEDARHQARGTSTPSIGARAIGARAGAKL
jgi:hypothetical protein